MDIRKVAGSVSLLLTLILATTPTRADEPQKDPDPANEDSDTPAPPPPPLRQPKKNATSTRTYSVDQYIPDRAANKSKERLERMRSNIEQHLKNKDLSEFQQHADTLHNDDDREAYYNNECNKFHIDC
jgi:hypothetical protein